MQYHFMTEKITLKPLTRTENIDKKTKDIHLDVFNHGLYGDDEIMYHFEDSMEDVQDLAWWQVRYAIDEIVDNI
jgi:hypothetical protein